MLNSLPVLPWRASVLMASSATSANLSDDKTPDLYASAAILWAASIIAVTSRVVARRLSHQKLWWDDWLIFFSSASRGNAP